MVELLKRLGGESEFEETDGQESTMQSSSKYADLMRLRVVHIIALFIFVYVGTEVRIPLRLFSILFCVCRSQDSQLS